ncbi:FAD-dependent oxidoreductase [Leucobacter luti]|uniref:FAD-dependent oxidoreductase n=1 Tax=Leucobacter luti TaxID=340320 RepID=UPI001C68A648|nr:FAD-dependent oxidoreductase [Leucobacter luti]QYM76726.1 FAD-dependent oxidoreductase [Leucobacter luti]
MNAALHSPRGTAVDRSSHFDVAIVGAGPAGLAAAQSALAAGVSVCIIDSGVQPGGQFWRHRSEAAGVPDDGALHHGWAEYQELRADFDRGRASGRLTHFPGTSVWQARRLERRFALSTTPVAGTTPEAPAQVTATSLILATGGYDRQLPVPGWELPGVYAAGGIQSFMKQNGSLPGARFVIAGTGPFLLPVAAGISRSGGTVAAVCEATDLTGWLPRAHRAAAVPTKGVEGAAYVGTFLRHRIPYRRRTVITEIIGTDRVTAVRTARVDRAGRPVPGSERVIDGVDAVGLGWGFTPQMELPVQLGVETRVDLDGSLVAVVDAAQRSSVPGLLIAGELTGVGGATLAVLEGRIAGRVAAGSGAARVRAASTSELRAIRRHRAFAAAMHLAHPVPAGWEDLVCDDTLVCRCEEVTAGSLRHARDELASDDSRSQKGITRAGMGWCQGRVCGFAVSCLAGGSSTPSAASLTQNAHRPVAQPLPLGALRMLADEPSPRPAK